MNLLKERAVDWLFFAILVSTAVLQVGGAGTIQNCVDLGPKECPLVCGGTAQVTAPQCVEDPSYKAADIATNTCDCGGKIGGEGPIDDDGEKTYRRYFCYQGDNGKNKLTNCVPCLDDTKTLYVCELQLTDAPANGGAPTISTPGSTKVENYICGCSTATDVEQPSPVPTTPGQTAGEQKGRRRGKFPPILAQLLKALQQVKSKFSGRP